MLYVKILINKEFNKGCKTLFCFTLKMFPKLQALLVIKGGGFTKSEIPLGKLGKHVTFTLQKIS